MKPSTLRKLGGVSITAGAILFAAWSFCWTFLLPVSERARDPSAMVRSPNWIWVSALAFAGILLMIFGFTALYSKIHRQSGLVGFLGYVLVTVAYVLEAAQVSWEVFVYPALISHPPSVALLRDGLLFQHPMVALFRMLCQAAILLGVLLLSAALIRCRGLLRAGGILFLAGAVLYAVGPRFSVLLAVGGVAILAAGCAVLGVALFRSADDAGAAPGIAPERAA